MGVEERDFLQENNNGQGNDVKKRPKEVYAGCSRKAIKDSSDGKFGITISIDINILKWLIIMYKKCNQMLNRNFSWQ